MDAIQKSINTPSVCLNILAQFIDQRMPVSHRGAPRQLSTKDVLTLTVFVAKSGIPWRCLQPCVSSQMITWHLVYKRFKSWVNKNLLEQAYKHILSLYHKRRILRKPINIMFTNTTFIKSIFGRDCVGPSPVDRARRATKLSVLVDDLGIPHACTYHPANKPDCRILRHTLHSTYLKGMLTNVWLSADKGYNTTNCRQWVKDYRMKDAILPSTSNFRRTIVENVFAWLDGYRRLIVRYDQQIATFRSFHYLAFSVFTYRRLKALLP